LFSGLKSPLLKPPDVFHLFLSHAFLGEIMHKTVQSLIAAFLLLFMAGCNAGLPPAEWANRPPSGAHIVHAPQLVVGDAWVYEKHRYGAEDPYKKWEEKVLKILPDNEYLYLIHRFHRKKIPIDQR
jgi:hypothetical protein